MVKRTKAGRHAAAQNSETTPQSWRCLFSLYLGRDKLRIADVFRLTGIHRNTLYRLYHDRMRLVDLEEIAVLCRLFKLSSIGDFFQLIDAPSNTKPTTEKPMTKKLAGVLPDLSDGASKKKTAKRAAKGK